MTDPQTTPTPDPQLLESVWAEARDLVRRLEGSSVQRLSVAAGDCKIEIERATEALTAGPGDSEAGFAPPPTGHLARTASGPFMAITEDTDQRIPVLAPLVGTFYRSPQPGAKPFVEEGDVIELGQTVCIVEAMKLMNEVAAGEAGKVAEIVANDGDPVEFDQVLMYLEPVGE